MIVNIAVIKFPLMFTLFKHFFYAETRAICMEESLYRANHHRP